MYVLSFVLVRLISVLQNLLQVREYKKKKKGGIVDGLVDTDEPLVFARTLISRANSSAAGTSTKWTKQIPLVAKDIAELLASEATLVLKSLMQGVAVSAVADGPFVVLHSVCSCLFPLPVCMLTCLQPEKDTVIECAKSISAELDAGSDSRDTKDEAFEEEEALPPQVPIQDSQGSYAGSDSAAPIRTDERGDVPMSDGGGEEKKDSADAAAPHPSPASAPTVPDPGFGDTVWLDRVEFMPEELKRKLEKQTLTSPDEMDSPMTGDTAPLGPAQPKEGVNTGTVYGEGKHPQARQHHLSIQLTPPRNSDEIFFLYRKFNCRLHEAKKEDQTQPAFHRHLVETPLLPEPFFREAPNLMQEFQRWYESLSEMDQLIISNVCESLEMGYRARFLDASRTIRAVTEEMGLPSEQIKTVVQELKDQRGEGTTQANPPPPPSFISPPPPNPDFEEEEDMTDESQPEIDVMEEASSIVFRRILEASIPALPVFSWIHEYDLPVRPMRVSSLLTLPLLWYPCSSYPCFCPSVLMKAFVESFKARTAILLPVEWRKIYETFQTRKVFRVHHLREVRVRHLEDLKPKLQMM